MTAFAFIGLAVVVVVAPAGATTANTGPVSAPADAGSIGLRLVDAPATSRDDPRAQMYIVDHLAPGKVIRRRIEVSNSTLSTTHIELYSSGASVTDGSFRGAAGHTPNDLSTWTSVAPGTSDIRAGGRAMATVTVAIPRDAAAGEQYGVVWAEARSASAPQGGVVQVSRVGIRLYVSIGQGGSPAADFSIDSLTAQRSVDGTPSITATVHNTGGRALDMNGTLQLSGGPGGLSAGPFPATLGVTLAPGNTRPVTIALDPRLPAGPWDAQVILRSGLLERSARATISFPVKGAAAAVTTTTTSPRGFASRNPAIVAAAVLLLLGGSAPLMLMFGRSKLRRLARLA